MNNLTICYTTEGNTDKRFLGNIIRRTFEELAFDCTGQIDVFDPIHILKEKDTFVDNIVEISKNNSWTDILCVHTDSDSPSDVNAFNNKIQPAINAVNAVGANNCKNIVPIVPIQMTEAWMLADIDLFMDMIYTDNTIEELGLSLRTRQIELLADPKNIIENALKIASSGFSRGRNKINIGELYSPISQRINIDLLKNIPSYIKFRNNSIQALKILNYMH